MRPYVHVGAGYCFWQKTSNGCKNKSDKFETDAYDFYALCRKGHQPKALFQCETQPSRLDPGKCEDRDGGHGEADDGHYLYYPPEYYRYKQDKTTHKKFRAVTVAVAPFAVSDVGSGSQPINLGVTIGAVFAVVLVMAVVAGTVFIVILRNRKRMELHVNRVKEGSGDTSSNASNSNFENAAQSVVDDDTIPRVDTHKQKVYRDSNDSSGTDDETKTRVESKNQEVYRDSLSSSEAEDDIVTRDDTQNRGVYRDSESASAVGNQPASSVDTKKQEIYRDDDSDSSSIVDDDIVTRADKQDSDSSSVVGEETVTSVDLQNEKGDEHADS